MSSRVEECGVESLPVGWSIRRIDSLLSSTIRDFGSFSMTNLIEFVDDGVPFIKSESVANGHINFDNIAYITERVHRLLTKSVVQKGDVLFTKIGAIGRVAVYDGRLGVCNSNAATAKIQISANQADTSFFAYQLGSERVKREFEKTIISTPPRINLGDINSMEIALPPLPQQRKIARILTTLDNVIAQTEALIAKYQAIKQGLMHDLFTRGVDATGELRPPQSEAPELYKQSDLGWIPKEWGTTILGSLLADVPYPMRSGPFGSSLLKADLVEQGIPYLGIDNIHRENFCPEFRRFVSPSQFTQLQRYAVREGDVVITIMGTVGRCCVIPAGIGNALSSKHIWTMSIAQERYLPALLCWQLNHSPWVLSAFRGKSQGGIMDSISSTTLKTLLVPHPSISEQREIARRYDSLTKEITLQESALEKLKLLKTGLMQDLLTGKVPVKAGEVEEVTING